MICPYYKMLDKYSNYYRCGREPVNTGNRVNAIFPSRLERHCRRYYPAPSPKETIVNRLTLRLNREELCIYRLPPAAAIPEILLQRQFCSITRTAEELSIVCSAGYVIQGAACEPGWNALQVVGPLDFALTGILSRLAACLAAAEISIFAISTFDTDYILIRKSLADKAVSQLTGAGYTIIG